MNAKPTNDELFDYHLGLCQPAQRLLIEAYLKTDLAAQAQLASYAMLEKRVATLPIPGPPEHVLTAVMKNAASALKPPLWSSAGFATFFRQRAVFVSALSILIVGGLYIQTRNLPSNSLSNSLLSGQPTPFSDAGLNATFQNTPAGTDLAKSVDEQLGDGIVTESVEQRYSRAVDMLTTGKPSDAVKLFSSIDAQAPQFTKKRELYTYWIEALERDGQKDLAEQKRQILQALPSE